MMIMMVLSIVYCLAVKYTSMTINPIITSYYIYNIYSYMKDKAACNMHNIFSVLVLVMMVLFIWIVYRSSLEGIQRHQWASIVGPPSSRVGS